MGKTKEQLIAEIKAAAAAEKAEFEAALAEADRYTAARRRVKNGLVAFKAMKQVWVCHNRELLDTAGVPYTHMGHKGSRSPYRVYALKAETLEKILGASNE